jgi:integrase
MPSGVLTQKVAEGLKPADEDYYFSDKKAGLMLLVRKSGSKTWLTMVRPKGAGKQVKVTIGKVGQLGFKDAKAEASWIILQARQGINVNEVEKKKREAEVAAGKDTVKAIWAEYVKREGPNLKSLDQRTAVFNRLILPELGGKQIDAITKKEVVRLLDGIEDDSGPRMADTVRDYLARLMIWHEGRSETYRCVITRAMPRRRKASAVTGARKLEDHELRAIWLAAEAESAGAFGQVIRLLLLTGARRNEITRLCRSEIKGDLWVLPSRRNKVKVDHAVPLSPAALAVLEDVPHIVGQDRVFQINATSHLKRDFDVACGVTGWSLHSLRKTARTLLSRSGISADVGEMCLGHLLKGVRRVYDKFDYIDQKRHAFKELAALIDRIVHPVDNVTALRG